MTKVKIDHITSTMLMVTVVVLSTLGKATAEDLIVSGSEIIDQDTTFTNIHVLA